LASLTEKPDLIARLFDDTTTNVAGVYSVWLNINGEWIEYLLDDFIPCHNDPKANNQPNFIFTVTEENEIWVQLLEKAYAKAYGSFKAIEGGLPSYAMRDLTGASFKMIENS
jgi:calpain-15